MWCFAVSICQVINSFRKFCIIELHQFSKNSFWHNNFLVLPTQVLWGHLDHGWNTLHSVKYKFRILQSNIPAVMFITVGMNWLFLYLMFRQETPILHILHSKTFSGDEFNKIKECFWKYFFQEISVLQYKWHFFNNAL